MSISTQQCVIDGVPCVVAQLPGMEGLRIWTTLVKLLGPSVAVLGKGIGDGIKDIKEIDEISELLGKEIDMDKVFSSISEALVLAGDNLSEDIVEQLVLRILACTKVDNKEVNSTSFNIMFSGNYGRLFKILAFTLKVNYASFLGDRGLSTSTDQSPSLSSVQP